METNQSTINQNLTGSEARPQQTGSNQKLFIAVVISVLLTSMLTGSAVYSWQKSVSEKAISGFEQKISSLEEQISTQTSLSSPSLTPTLPSGSEKTTSWKLYTNSDQGIEFKYPQDYFVHEMSGSKFSIIVNQSLEFKMPSGTDAPVFGIRIGLTGCTRPDIEQTYPCEKTPDDAILGLKLRKYLVDSSISTSEITISDRTGKQISGRVSNENEAYIPIAGSFYKATYFSNNSTKDGEYLIIISLLEREQRNERLYDRVLSTLKFTDG